MLAIVLYLLGLIADGTSWALDARSKYPTHQPK